jgi:hypothetical protein
MKKIYFFLALTILGASVQAQTNVYFKINHLLDGNSFAYNQTATTGRNATAYQLTRLEYYISEIVLTHDNGQQTPITNKWMLVDAGNPTNEFLGNLNITNLESISFGIGVDTSVNHDDPSLYASTHPLAPKSPSMHWGWSAGYRFVAFEGRTGSNFSQVFQIHALGDRNYSMQTHNTAGYRQNGDLIIEIDADYNMALNTITVNGNLLYHGEFNEAATLLSNFQSSVFTQSIVGLQENRKRLQHFAISPNPGKGELLVEVDKAYQQLTYKVLDLTGREVIKGALEGGNKRQLAIPQKGIYMLNLYENGALVGSEKVIVQ